MPAVPGAHEAAATARFRQDLSARSPSFYLGLSMDTIAPLWLWLTFVACVLAALFVDFVVLRKQGELLAAAADGSPPRVLAPEAQRPPAWAEARRGAARTPLPHAPH